MPETPCLRLEGLTKHFGGLAAVEEVELVVEDGERRGIIGPNGAGKTTLFNLITGDLRPTRGKVYLHGREITNLGCHERAYLGIARTFQVTNLFPKLTVMDNVLLAAQALERSKFSILRPIDSYPKIYKRAEGALDKLNLLEKRDELIKNLSYGDQRQIEIALTLVGNPKLLLLDEPTAGLPPAESARMVSLLKELDSAITVLIIEHDMDVALDLADKIMVLHDGSVLADGPREEVQANETVQDIYLGFD
jgi:branched-chain amino acid transport system ATP-binding protein